MSARSPTRNLASLVGELRESLPALSAALPVGRVVLFGSWAKGRATAHSDVDLLVVYADPPRDDAYKLVRRLLRVRGLEPHVYAESEAERLEAVLSRMTDGGVVLTDVAAGVGVIDTAR